jgi:DNA topoisomerase-1
MSLVIVESPGKTKKIQSFLGRDYTVAASVGHVRDLASTRANRLGVDLENGFKPLFQIDAKKKNVVDRLKRLSSGKRVILASDEDREGEAIAESLRDILKLKEGDYTRILFNEITKKAILSAINQPTKINYRLVEAQLTRRILDRLFGFELSPLISKIPELDDSGFHSLGTGRVQSVVVRLIVEREQDIDRFLADREEMPFMGKGQFELELSGQAFDLATDLYDEEGEPVKLSTVGKATQCLQELLNSQWHVKSLDCKTSLSKPSPPFTTSTLQQEASNRLGFSVKKTMTLAQKLYENGHITYHRTDSTVLSDNVLRDCQQLITEQFDPSDHRLSQYQTKSKSAQEAHEAIRPTDVKVRESDLDGEGRQLYRLIWERTVASQMIPAKYLVVKIVLTNQGSPVERVYLMKGELRQLEVPGYLKARTPDITPEVGSRRMAEYQQLPCDQLVPHFKWAKLAQQVKQPPSHYGEASLVKRLEQLGIGRPSTYVSIISRVQDHEYVECGDIPGQAIDIIELTGQDGEISKVEKETFLGRENRRLLPTKLGKTVNKFLTEHFATIVDYGFTSQMEEQLDDIANGNQLRVKILGDFYQLLKKSSREYLATKPAPTPGTATGSLKRWEELFTITSNDLEYRVYLGKTRYGTALRLIDSKLTETESVKTKRALFLDWKKKDHPTQTEVMKILSGSEEPATLAGCQLRKGPYGHYLVTANGDKVSLPKDVDPEQLTEEQVEAILNQKKQTVIKTVKTFQVKNGPHGPYIQVPPKSGKGKPQFFKIPEEYRPEELDEETIQKIMKMPKRKAGRT